LKGEEIAPGEYRVLRGPFSFVIPGSTYAYDTLGVSKVSDFKTFIQNVIDTSDLVFIGHIDSTIGDGLTNVTAPSGVVAAVTLFRTSTADTSYGKFYARLTVDTLIKGRLPSKSFWFKAFGYGSSCNVYPSEYQMGGRFLNFSDKFDHISDLKMPKYSTFCTNCPVAYWFDGRYLRAPEFPVLALDITSIYPSYPATSITRRTSNVAPWKPIGKGYRPDGRIAPKSGRKSAVPVFK
jgi:hypothetical protein